MSTNKRNASIGTRAKGIGAKDRDALRLLRDPHMSAELLHQPSISSGSTSSPGARQGTKAVRICVHKNNVYIDHAFAFWV